MGAWTSRVDINAMAIEDIRIRRSSSSELLAMAVEDYYDCGYDDQPICAAMSDWSHGRGADWALMWPRLLWPARPKTPVKYWTGRPLANPGGQYCCFNNWTTISDVTTQVNDCDLPPIKKRKLAFEVDCLG